MSTADNGSSRPAEETWPNLSSMSAGHTHSRQRSGKPPASISHQPPHGDPGIFQSTRGSSRHSGGGAANNIPSRTALRHCFEHPEEELKLYCEPCGELVCYQCGLKGGKHCDHDYALFKKAFEKYKEEITSSLEPMEKQP